MDLSSRWKMTFLSIKIELRANTSLPNFKLVTHIELYINYTHILIYIYIWFRKLNKLEKKYVPVT